PQVRRSRIPSADGVLRFRRRLDQHNGDMLIERDSFHPAAEVETAEVRQTVMQQDQVRLELNTLPHSGFSVLCREYVIALILQECFPGIAVLGNCIYKKQDS